jgi:hypothetical protein
VQHLIIFRIHGGRWDIMISTLTGLPVPVPLPYFDLLVGCVVCEDGWRWCVVGGWRQPEAQGEP